MATREELKQVFANGQMATGEKFANLIDSMKLVQLPVVDPQALGTSLSFIDSISQDADGKITATKKTLDLANAHELNPFKGWYKTGDTLPTSGFDGAYLYFKDTDQTPAVTTIYRWNGTTYTDTGTVVDESNVQTFETGQAVNTVGIDDKPTPGSNNLVKSGGVSKKFGIPYSLIIEGSVILYNGTKISQSGFGMSAPIFLKEGETVFATTKVVNVAVISLTNEQGTAPYTTVAGTPSGETAVVKTYSYTAIEDCYVVVSVNLLNYSDLYYTDILLFDKDKGIANGVAPLNNSSKIDKNYLPDIEEQDLPNSTYIVSKAYIGKKELNYSIIGKYILYNPNSQNNAHLIDGTQSTVTTPPIFLRKYETIQVRCGGKGFAAIALTDSTGSQYTIIAGTKALDPLPENPITYSYTAVEDCYVASSVILTSFDEENSYIRGAKDFLLPKDKGIPNGVAPLNNNTKINKEYLPDPIPDLLEPTNILIPITINGEVILYNGTKIQQEGLGMSAPIFLRNGETVSVITKVANVAVISLTNEQGTAPYTRVAGTPNGETAVMKTYTYTAVEDCYVVLSVNLSYFSNPYYTGGPSIAEKLVDGGGNETNNVTIILESGTFVHGTGEPIVADLTINPYVNYFSRKFLKVEGALLSDFIFSSDYNLVYIFYDENFLKIGNIYIGDGTELIQPPQGAKYARFALEKIDNTTPDSTDKRNPILTFKLASSYGVKWVFDGCRPLGDSFYNTPYKCAQMIQYELSSVPLDYNTVDPAISSYVGNNNIRAFNTGAIMLPKNYREDGEPVPLVIFFPGTQGWVYNQTEAANDRYKRMFNVLLDNGYAVCRCGTFTNLYTASAYGHLEEADSRLNELGASINIAIKCHQDLYNYIRKYYNVQPEVFGFGQSAGGLLGAWFAYHRIIPFKCIAGFAPSLDFYQNWKILARSYDINWWARRMGITETELQSVSEDGIPGSHNWTAEQQNVIETFYTKMLGLNPFFLGLSNISIQALAHELVHTGFSSTALMNNTTLQNMINQAYKIQPTPIKFWQAWDDENVPMATAVMWKKMVDNAGGYCSLRVMPNDAGKHFCCVGIDTESVLKTTIHTKYGGDLLTTVGFAELLDWFEEWK